MKCPVCKSDLYEYDAHGLRVDICRDGCSGMWFDAGELEKCDQHEEPFPAKLLRVRKSPNVLIDRSAKRECPRCLDKSGSQTNTLGPTLSRVVIDPELRFEFDHCDTCKGYWLDIGELEHLRKEDKERSEIDARIAEHERKVNEQLQDVDRAHLVKAFLHLLFKSA